MVYLYLCFDDFWTSIVYPLSRYMSLVCVRALAVPGQNDFSTTRFFISRFYVEPPVVRKSVCSRTVILPSRPAHSPNARGKGSRYFSLPEPFAILYDPHIPSLWFVPIVGSPFRPRDRCLWPFCVTAIYRYCGHRYIGSRYYPGDNYLRKKINFVFVWKKKTNVHILPKYYWNATQLLQSIGKQYVFTNA